MFMMPPQSFRTLIYRKVKKRTLTRKQYFIKIIPVVSTEFVSRLRLKSGLTNKTPRRGAVCTAGDAGEVEAK
jgi:hypothetical protein